MDDAKHIRAQRAQIKQKMRTLEQEVERLIVRQFLFISLINVSCMPVLGFRS